MTYTEEQCDITTIDKTQYAVGHCIAADLNWGGGIAPIVIRKMYDAENECRYKCSTNPDGCRIDLAAGQILVIRNEKGILINLITKTHSWDKPTYLSITRSIVKMRDYMLETGLKKLCIPYIGCGIDRLEWEVVSNIVRGVFCDTDIEVKVVYMNEKKIVKEQSNG